MQILGILIDKPYTRIALIEKTRGGRKVIYLNSHSSIEPESVKQLYTKNFKGKIFGSLAAEDLLMKKVEINIGNSKHLSDAISFQVEAASHLDKEETLSDAYILEMDKEKTSVLLFTAPKQKIQERLNALESLGFDPDRLTATPLALVEYFQWKMESLKNAFIVDLGSSEWTCVCLKDGELKTFHSISHGTNALLDALFEDRKKTLFPKEVSGIAKQIDLFQAKKELNPHLFEKLQEMKQELARVIFSFSSKHGKMPLFFTGSVDAFSQMEEFLKKELEEFLGKGPDLEIPKNEKKYAIAMGLGLSEKPLQFRKGEFFPTKTWRSLGRFAFLIATCSCFIGAGISLFSNYAYTSKSQEMVSSLESSLLKLDPDLAKNIFKGKSEEEVLRRWDKAVATHLKKPAYMAEYPKVTESLSWIYNHPLTKLQTDPISITSFHYMLTDYPNLDNPREKYRAKVEIEFETKSPLNARKFHEEIHAGNGPCDNREEIGWDVTETQYRTSFYLKERLP